jgi:hypothetical protein
LKYLSIDKRGDGVRAKISLSQVQNCKKAASSRRKTGGAEERNF